MGTTPKCHPAKYFGELRNVFFFVWEEFVPKVLTLPSLNMQDGISNKPYHNGPRVRDYSAFLGWRKAKA